LGSLPVRVDRRKYENLLTGAYADGWAGPILDIQVTPAACAQTPEIEFFAPHWLPQSKLTIQVRRGGKSQGASLEVALGANAHWSLPLEPGGGCHEIRIVPTFVSARSGHGDDQRELSAMLQRCSIVRADGEYIELFPEKAMSRTQLQVWDGGCSRIKRLSSIEQQWFLNGGPRLEQQSTDRDVPEFDGNAARLPGIQPLPSAWPSRRQRRGTRDA
jgi:hypothetical protein